MKAKYKILFPCDFFNMKKVDEAFEPEKRICDLLGIEYFFFNHEALVDEGKVLTTIPLDKICSIIYRGWMLKPEQYRLLTNTVFADSNYKVTFINSAQEYEYCHCFPKVYPFLKEWTPRIIELDNWEKIFTTDIPFDFFIKDSVKSVKNQFGQVRRLLKPISKEELIDEITAFVKERGKLLTGNIILKEFVDLKRYDGKTNEWRVFYADQDELRNQSHLPSPIMDNFLTYFQNSNLMTNEHPPLKLIQDVGRRLHHFSSFFTVDFALTENDDWIVIETGDGQVSGLPMGVELQFYNHLSMKLV